MKHLAATSWLVHGESGVPLWLVLPVAAASLYFLLRWLRAERRKNTWPSRLLPFTVSMLVLLPALLIWRPAVTRIDTWSEPSGIVVLVDESASMDTSLAGGELSDRLDVLELHAPESVQGRPAAARNMAAVALEFASQADGLHDHLQHAVDEAEQGVPPTPSMEDPRAEMEAWTANARRLLLSAMDSLHEDASLLGDGATAAEAEAVLPESVEQAIAGLTGQFALLPPAQNRDSAALLAWVRDASTRLRAAAAPLAEMQAAADAAYTASRGKALDTLLHEVSRMSRLDAAQRLAAGIRGARVLPTTARDSTDIAGEMAKLLDDDAYDGIGDLIILSDGGQNAPVRPDLADRLRKSGVRVTAVGIGRPDHEADLAILDWRLPGVVVARRDAAVRVLLKAPPDHTEPVMLVLSSSGVELASSAVNAGRWVELPFTAPDAGRHLLAIEIKTPNASRENDRVELAVDVVRATPKVLLVGQEPDWDTTYLYLAMQAARLDAQQVYQALGGGPPSRGSTRQAIPKTDEQWRRFQAIVLHGPPFAGFDVDDANALFQFVSKEGGTLLIFAKANKSYVDVLAKTFGWEQAGTAIPDCRLALAPEGRHLPVMRLAPDGAASDRLLSELGPCGAAVNVPRQQIPLLLARNGETVLSLGFYGRGKVYLCGIAGFHRMAEFAQAEIVDRLLSQLAADAAAAMFTPEDAPIAVYPSAAARAKANVLVSAAPDAAEAWIDGAPLALAPGRGNRIAVFAPEKAGSAVVSIGARSVQVPVVDNPGLEQINCEFDGGFLAALAEEAGGSYLELGQAQDSLDRLKPRARRTSTAARYPIGDHWCLFAALALAGTGHWVLRKLSGLAM